MSTYLTVGSICWDLLDDGAERRLGGSARFASRVARSLGWEAVVLTSGTAELEAAARDELTDVELVVQRSGTDTAFAFDAHAEFGPHRLAGRATTIDLTSPEAAALVARADVVHLAPVMAEIDDATFAAARQAPFVGLTPQGLLRAADPVTGELDRHGRYPAAWVDLVDAVVLSESEAERLADLDGLLRTRSVVTLGERGCVGRWGDDEILVPGIPVDADPVATIGAGDVFATTCFIALAGGISFPAALAEANRTAAAHVGRLR